MHSGYCLFPNIYFGNEHIGGYDDLLIHFKRIQTYKKRIEK